MKLYIVRHGEAADHEDDRIRPLTKKGVKETKKIARHLAAIDTAPGRIYHSTLLRAKETAEIIGRELKKSAVEEVEKLKPSDNPAFWAKKLRVIEEPVMLVGHQPHLGELAGMLLTGAPDGSIISFRKSSVACFERDGSGAWTLLWLITPKVI